MDLISRQAAIGYIDRVMTIGTGKKKSLDFVRKYIKALPDISSYLIDRPCAVCKCHTDDGCSEWECVFERRADG